MRFLEGWNNLFKQEDDKCLICSNVIEYNFGWSDILFEKQTSYLCDNCRSKLSKITGPTCRRCSREIQHLHDEYVQDGICLDCIRWQNSNYYYLDGNTSVYNYNDFMKEEIISRIKYRGDYRLMDIFKELMKDKVTVFKKDEIIVIPIPLSEERHIERGFNQTEAFGLTCGFELNNALSRIHSEKQSKKSRSERLNSEQVFRLESTGLSNKKILLLDDIYTTGTTLQHASKVLKVQGGAKEVWSLTIARS